MLALYRSGRHIEVLAGNDAAWITRSVTRSRFSSGARMPSGF
jgi:hypothetical protein